MKSDEHIKTAIFPFFHLLFSLIISYFFLKKGFDGFFHKHYFIISLSLVILLFSFMFLLSKNINRFDGKINQLFIILLTAFLFLFIGVYPYRERGYIFSSIIGTREGLETIFLGVILAGITLIGDWFIRMLILVLISYKKEIIEESIK